MTPFAGKCVQMRPHHQIIACYSCKDAYVARIGAIGCHCGRVLGVLCIENTHDCERIKRAASRDLDMYDWGACVRFVARLSAWEADPLNPSVRAARAMKAGSRTAAL
jgi:hypothetical protein